MKKSELQELIKDCGHLVHVDETPHISGMPIPLQKIVEMTGEHPNIQTKIIATGIDIDDAWDLVEHHNAMRLSSSY